MFRALLASGYFWQVVTTEDMINAIFFTSIHYFHGFLLKNTMFIPSTVLPA